MSVDSSEARDARARKLTARYDADSTAYRELWAPTLRLASVPLVRELPAAGVRRLVDIGAGVGALWPELRSAFPGARLLGIDRSHGMLRLAPSDVPRVVSDARALPVESDRVDLAVLVFMLFHLERPGDALREARRIVRPGGTVGTITWGVDLASPATRLWTACLDEHGAAPSDPVTQARHELVDTPDKMSALLRSAGFETVRAWTDDIVTVMVLEHLVALKTRMGSEKARFDSLDTAARGSCIVEARRRLGNLTPSDFTARGTIVYAVAS